MRRIDAGALLGILGLWASGGCGDATDADGDASEAGTSDATDDGDTDGDPDDGDSTGSTGDPTTLSGQLDPNDVAILFPLPPDAASDALLRHDADTGRGALLPSHVRDALPGLQSPTNDTLWDSLRVVSAVVEPCSRDSADSSACHRQVRLVLQPVTLGDGTTSTTTTDTALHALYELDEAEFATLIGELLTLKVTWGVDTSGPLRVHPALADEEPGGPRARQLQAVLASHIGADNLTRVTFFLQRVGTSWQMGGVDVSGSVVTNLVIPVANAYVQDIGNTTTSCGDDGAFEDFAAGILPDVNYATGLLPLMDSATARASSDAALREAYRTALAIENPELNDPNTVDCASCHMATPLRTWAQRHADELSFVDLESDPLDAMEGSYGSDFDLTLASETTANTKAFRAFGYYNDRTSFSYRKVNEAAAAASRINDELVPAWLGQPLVELPDDGIGTADETPVPERLPRYTLPDADAMAGDLVLVQDTGEFFVTSRTDGRIYYGSAGADVDTELELFLDLGSEVAGLSPAALTPDGRYLAGVSGQTVTLVDLEQGAVLGSATVPGNHLGIGIDPSGAIAYVSDGNSNRFARVTFGPTSTVDTFELSELPDLNEPKNTPVTTTATGVWVTPDGAFALVNYRTGIVRIDLESLDDVPRVQWVDVGAADVAGNALFLTEDGQRLYSLLFNEARVAEFEVTGEDYDAVRFVRWYGEHDLQSIPGGIAVYDGRIIVVDGNGITFATSTVCEENGGGGGQAPPPELLEACDGKASGDPCSASIDGMAIDGLCTTTDAGLTCLPNQGPGGEEPGPGMGGGEPSAIVQIELER